MFIVDVIPISRGILKEKLSYWSSKDVPLGSLVEVPLRKKMISALVIGKENASQNKASIKSADFQIKKIEKLKFSKFLPQEFIETCSEAAKYFASTTGAILSASLPKSVLENMEKIEFKTFPSPSPNSHEKLALQAGEQERLSTYKSLIREEFAKKNSILFIAPTIEDTERIAAVLEKGIEDYAFFLNGNVKKKEMIDLCNKIASIDHPILLVATPQFMFLPRQDFKTMILEKENSSAYRQLSRPYLDMRIFAEILAKKTGMRLIFGDIFLRVETVWRQKNLELSEFTSMKFRSVSNAVQQFVSMSKEEKDSGKFPVISQKMLDVIERGVKSKKLTFVFGLRKGLHPLIVCKDCGEILRCRQCSAPAILHEVGKKRLLVCNKCGEKAEVTKKCQTCQSWRLEPLGIGIELIEKELKEKLSEKIDTEVKILRLDKDSAKTPRQAANTIIKFYSSPGSILIGTEMALLYLFRKIDNMAVVSVDSLFSIPDFRISEKALSLLLRLRSFAKENFIIQSRHEEYNLWQYALGGNAIDFYREEIDLRKKLNYPPFSILIKITLQGQKNPVEKEMEKLTEFLREYNPSVYPAFTSQVKGKYIMHTLIKHPREKWPDKELVQKLHSLSPKFTIKVDPDSIL